MKILVVKPHDPEPDSYIQGAKHVFRTFLAGTIDAGNSEDWQTEYINEMYSIADNVNQLRKHEENFNVNDCVLIIYNPRRNSGDGFTPNNTEEMDYQVNWELDHLELVDSIYMNLLATSKSPISLLELGLFARTDKLKVTCPKEFYRYENVRSLCERYNIPLRNSEKENWPKNEN